MHVDCAVACSMCAAIQHSVMWRPHSVWQCLGTMGLSASLRQFHAAHTACVWVALPVCSDRRCQKSDSRAAAGVLLQ
jgi:hypothetical protein